MSAESVWGRDHEMEFEVKGHYTMAPLSTRITVSFEDGFAILRMNDGENRFNPDFVSAFNAALDQVERNESCKALITTGTGKFYSNGLDLAWMAQQEPERVMAHLATVSSLTNRILYFPIPTIAAINGHAYAMGCFLALVHDFRVMRPDRGWICLNEIHIKMVIRGFMLDIIKMKVPAGAVQRDMMLFGRRYTAEEAVKAGIVDQAAELAEILPRSKALAGHYLTKQGLDRDTLQKLKESLYDGFKNSSKL